MLSTSRRMWLPAISWRSRAARMPWARVKAEHDVARGGRVGARPGTLERRGDESDPAGREG